MTQPGRTTNNYGPDHDGIDIPKIKRLIWEAAGGKFTDDGRHIASPAAKLRIHMAQIQLNWPGQFYLSATGGHVWEFERDATMYKWSELLKHLQGENKKQIPPMTDAEAAIMRKHSFVRNPTTDPRILAKRIREESAYLYDRAYKPAGIVQEVIETEPIKAGTNSYDVKSMQTRYQQAHERWFEKQYPAAYGDGHYVKPKYPSCSTANGIQSLITNYLTWMGHFANRTNNQGQARKKEVEKFNIMSGKLEKITIGVQYTKSHSQKGMQDVDCNLVHPKHPYGIPWKIEVKAGKDKLSDDQRKFAARVTKTGAVHSVVTSDESFFSQYDGLMQD
jgi:hypothetical protein